MITRAAINGRSDPSGSDLTEQCWTKSILDNSGCRLLLDLHNLYANALNFGLDPESYLHEFPLSNVNIIHLSGGVWVTPTDRYAKQSINLNSLNSDKYLLDDHLHDVPSDVFQLLTQVAAHTPQPLTVIIERDGNYPLFDALLHQIDMARNALQAGRNRLFAANKEGLCNVI